MATKIMDNATQKRYCEEWSGGWVVAGMRATSKEEMDAFQERWPLAEPGIWMDEEYLQRRDAAWFTHQHTSMNVSQDFATEREARSWMVECAKHGANYLVCMSPDNYQFCLDSMDDPKIHYIHMNFIAQQIRWLMGE